MPDGFSYPLSSPQKLPARQANRGYLAAAAGATVLHGGLLLAVLWMTTHLAPPASVASVEITPIPEASSGPAHPSESPTEAASPAPPSDAAPTPAPPEAAAPSAQPERATVQPTPPDAVKTPQPPEAVANAAPSDSVAHPPPDAADMLSSNDPVATEQPSEIVHADTPPAEQQALPLPPAPPRPATPPRPPRLSQ